jgi:hypothetical protein
VCCYALVDFGLCEPEAFEVLPLLGARRAGNLLGNAERGEAAFPKQLPPPTNSSKGMQTQNEHASDDIQQPDKFIFAQALLLFLGANPTQHSRY